MAITAWQRITDAADKYNEPGRFTAFIGYEWTSAPEGNNMHRVVVFRDAKDKADQVLPFSQYDSDDPEDLWTWMADYEKKTGGRLLAIPHNGNLSNGLDVRRRHVHGEEAPRPRLCRAPVRSGSRCTK